MKKLLHSELKASQKDSLVGHRNKAAPVEHLNRWGPVLKQVWAEWVSGEETMLLMKISELINSGITLWCNNDEDCVELMFSMCQQMSALPRPAHTLDCDSDPVHPQRLCD